MVLPARAQQVSLGFEAGLNVADFGLVLGGGLGWRLVPGTISLEVGYEYGLTT